MNYFLRIIQIIVLSIIASILFQNGEKYDETKALSLRMQSNEDAIQEFRMTLNSVGTIALTNLEREKTFIEEVEYAYQRKKADGKKIAKKLGIKIPEGIQKIREGGAETPPR